MAKLGYLARFGHALAIFRDLECFLWSKGAEPAIVCFLLVTENALKVCKSLYKSPKGAHYYYYYGYFSVSLEYL